MIAKFVVAGAALGLQDEACKIAAILSVRYVWLMGGGHTNKVTSLESKLCVAKGEHMPHLNVFNARQANDLGHNFRSEMAQLQDASPCT